MGVAAVDIALVGKGAHLVVIAGVVLGFLAVCDRFVVDHTSSPRRRLEQRLTLLALVFLLGGAFRFIPLETAGRQMTSGASLVAAAALAGWLARGGLSQQQLTAPGPLKWMLAYAMAAFPSVAIATDSLAALGGAGGILATVLTSLAVGLHLERSSIMRLLAALAVAAAVVALSSLLLTPSASIQEIRSPVLPARFVGWFPFLELGWGHLGVGFVVIALTATNGLHMSVGRTTTQRRLVTGRIGVAFVGCALIAVTQARGAAISLIVVILAWVVLEVRRWLPIVVAFLAVVSVAAVTVQPVRDLWDREQAIAESDSLLTYRADFVRAALSVADRSPLIGRGIDSGTVDDFSAELTIGRSDLVTSTHMAWTSALAGTGLLGTACLIGAFVAAWRWAIRSSRRTGSVASPATWPLLVMVWTTVSSFFVVGPAELSAQSVAFGLGVVSVSVAEQRSSRLLAVAELTGSRPE